MALAIGIVGLPNVGKSTLFNALSSAAQAQAANYPFCTIEPNRGTVTVPDERLSKLSKLYASKKIVPTTLEFVDIAGLVRGASKGEGLGNQFLAHIREVNTVAHVLRCFEDTNIVHVEGSIDPARDAATIDTELALKDLETVDKRVSKLQKDGKSPGKAGEEAKFACAVMEKVKAALDQGQPARRVPLTAEERLTFQDLFLLTDKPVVYVANVSESELANAAELPLVKQAQAVADADHAPLVIICAEMEAQIQQLPEEERPAFLEAAGLKEPGLNRLIRAGYELLGLITYITCGEQETRAWTVHKGATAPQAAGVIHTDFERGFIKAEVFFWEEIFAHGTEAKLREKGLLRIEGKEYIVKDGDVMHFRFNT